MKQITAVSVLALMLGACANSGEPTTQSSEAAKARAAHDALIQQAENIGDAAGEQIEMADKAAPDLMKPVAEDVVAQYRAIISAGARPAEDLELDNVRKPARILAFAGVKRGMEIFEMEAGGGYFTEILSLATGSKGKIYMQNPAAFDAFFDGKPKPPRLYEGRLNNVEYVKTQFDDLKLADNTVDMVTWMQGPHELWYQPEGAPDGLGDPEKSFSEIARILKPGGVFIALDHAAKAGAPETTGGDIHRIDPAIVIGYAEKAGLKLVDSSDTLANPKDNKDANVFAPDVRGKTDQFLLKFKKPK